MIYRAGEVYVGERLAGILADTSEGYTFKYDEEYIRRDDAKSVSLTLPISQDTYVSKVIFPFFDGLIPEGWLLNLIIDNWKINPKDRFGILMVACIDCIGDVSIREIEGI